MNPPIEQTIRHFYPHRALVSPLEDARIQWTYDPNYETLNSVLKELRALDANLRPGTRGDYDLSEELILFGDVHLQLSYLGPFASIDFQLERDESERRQSGIRAVRRVLEAHGIVVLDEDALTEAATWIRHARATVWNCLFVAGDGSSPPSAVKSAERVEVWQ